MLRCTEEGTLSVKVGCVMGMVPPGRSNLHSLTNEQKFVMYARTAGKEGKGIGSRIPGRN